MKLKRLFAFGFIALILSFSTVGVFAVEDESSSASESQYEESSAETEPETEQTEDTEPETEETEPETEETQPETEETQPETQATQETQATYETESQETQDTFAVLDNDLSNLPEAETTPSPTAARKKSDKNADMTYGIVSWACVIVGLLTVLIVIISNKTH